MPISRSRVSRVSVALGAAFAAATLSLVAQGPAPVSQSPAPPVAGAPASQTPPATPPQGAPAGPGRGRGPSMMEPDFSKKPPVLPLTPAEEAKRFWLPPGFKMELGPVRSRHRGAGADCLRRQRPDVRRSSCAATCRTRTAPASWIRSAASRVHEDRDNDGVYETHKVFVDKLVFPRFVMPFGAERHPHEGIERRRGLEVHRHERRRRRPTRRSCSPPASAGLLNVEHQESGLIWAHGQLDLQHHQPGPPALDAERRAARADRVERRRSGA